MDISERQLLRWSESLAAIARTGLGFTESLYEKERFEEVLRVAADISVAAVSGSDGVEDADRLVEEWMRTVGQGVPGYVTPKVAVGAAVGNGEPIATTGCTWSWGRATTTLSLWDASKWNQMKSATLAGVTKSSVSGLGDDAFSATMGTSKQFAVLNVKKGATVYIFKVYGVDSPSDQLSIEKTLAADVLATLSP